MTEINGFKEIFGQAVWPQDKLFEVYAFVAEVEKNDDNCLILLELLSLDGEQVSPAGIRGSSRTVETFFQVSDVAQLEQQWRVLSLSQRAEGELILSILASLGVNEGVPYSIEGVKQTPEFIIADYQSPVGDEASEEDISRLFDISQKSQKLAVLDVGQGAAAFLYSQHDFPFPLVYFDIGGGCYPNAHTFPSGGVRWCFTQKPSIILSHWHWDHWAGATYGGTRNVAGPCAATWLVPPVSAGPLARKFANKIRASGGKVIYWPAGTSFIKSGRLIVGNATGKSWNDSGLVVLAELEDNRLSLIPGDAAYIYLPAIMQNKPLKTLLIAHHGGWLDAVPPTLLPYPDAEPNCYAYCSVGDQNVYGHPKLISSYRTAGWSVVQTDTRLQGQPAFHYDAETGGTCGGIVHPPCGGTICSLILHT